LLDELLMASEPLPAASQWSVWIAVYWWAADFYCFFCII
jgi:hypothetical protein